MGFHLQDAPIDPTQLRRALEGVEIGAYVSFEGWVRNHHQGRAVTALTYEAYPPLAEAEGLALVEELRAVHGATALACVHRVGALRPGDIAVWVGATAAHRDAAFAACRATIDAIKARVPIWKHEFYADGTELWVGSETTPRRSGGKSEV